MIKNLINKYITFIKYLSSAGISCVIDIVCFTIFSYLFKDISFVSNILLSTIAARIISSLINFMINKNKVFNNNGSNMDEHKMDLLINYYLLVIIQMFASAIFVEITYKLIGFNLVITKFVVDCFIFLINYFIQKKFIFNNKFIQVKKYTHNVFNFIKKNKEEKQ